MSGPVVGNFRMDGRLGSGTFATVWLAWDPDLERQVAIKVLADNWSVDEDIRRRFLEEARILWRLDNPRIVRVFSTGTLDDGRPYFVMEYADRRSLLERIQAHKEQQTQFSVGEAISLSLRIAEGLIVAHANGVVHRDLKPSNILFSTMRSSSGNSNEKERLMLADFGIARRLEGTARMTIAAGTPFYMAPEQADPTPTKGPSERSDIYSAATILYELLAGAVPYPFENVSEIRRAQERRNRTSIQSIRTDVPDGLARVIDKGLEPDPDARFASAQEWADALSPYAVAGYEEETNDVAMRQTITNDRTTSHDEEGHAGPDRRQERRPVTGVFTRLSRSQRLGTGVAVAFLILLGVIRVHPWDIHHGGIATPTVTAQPTPSATSTQQSNAPTATAPPTVTSTNTVTGLQQLKDTFSLMNTNECIQNALRPGTDAVYGCDDMNYHVTYTDYISNIEMVLNYTNLRSNYSTTAENWSYKSNPNVIQGQYLEFVDQNGFAEIFWTFNNQHMSGEAVAPDSSMVNLKQWWSTVANVKPAG